MTQPCRFVIVDSETRLGEWHQVFGLTAPLARQVLADWGVSPRAAVVQAVADGRRLWAALPDLFQIPGWRFRVCQLDAQQLVAIVENQTGAAPPLELVRLLRSLCANANGNSHASGQSTDTPLPRALIGSLDLGRKSVVLVEDDALVRSVCRRILWDKFAVCEAASGQAALELGSWLGAPVDLLISDVNLPKMDGIRLAGHWLERWPNTRILLLSGSFLPEVACNLPAIFLQKPFRAEELLNCANIILGPAPVV